MTEKKKEEQEKRSGGRRPADFAEQIRRANESNPFMLHNHIRAVSLKETQAAVEAEIEPDSLNAMGSVHGGLMFVMAEVAAGLATRNDGRRYVTLDSSFRFIKGSNSAKTLLAEAAITKRGRTVCFARTSVREPGSGILLAEGDFTFYCLDAS